MKKPHMTERGLRQKIARAGIRITPLINKALEQAKASHKEQKRDDGSPYLEQHIYPVASEMIDSLDEKRAIKRRRQISEKAIAAALLHDVLEDDRSLSDREFIRKFGREVYALVKPLTKPPKENRRRQSQEEKRRINEAQLRKISKAHRIARLIKLADRLNNFECNDTANRGFGSKYKRYFLEVEELYLPFAEKESAYFYGKLKRELKRRKKEFGF